MVCARRSFLIVLTLALAPATWAWAVTVQDVVDQVSQVSYTQYLYTANFLYTHDGDNRGIGGANNHHDDAQANIYTTFQSFGLITSLDPFLYSGQTYYNVIGVHEGILYPNRMYIIGAHYDSVNNPGADDNASGVAGVLEAARVLSQYNFESTIVFIAFDREEQGLIGSSAYAAAHSGDDIRGMISMDMIAHAGNNPGHARLYDGGGSTNTAYDLRDDLYTYSATVPAEKITGIWWGSAYNSDHAPFGQFVNGSVLLIEHDFSPYYHQPTDSVDTPNYIDYAYATKMTRGVVGFLAEAAVLYEAGALVPEPCGVLLVVPGLIGLLIVLRGRR